MNNEQQTEETKFKEQNLNSLKPRIFVAQNLTENMIQDVTRRGGYALDPEYFYGLHELYTEILKARSNNSKEIVSHLTNKGIIGRLNNFGIPLGRKEKPEHFSLEPDDVLYVISSVDGNQLRRFAEPDAPPLPGSIRLRATRYCWLKKINIPNKCE